MNKMSITKTAFIALLFGFYGLLATGCGDSSYPELSKVQPADPHRIVSKYISARDEMPRDGDRPRIIVGKPMPDVAGIYHVSEGNLVLAEPSQIWGSADVVIDDIKYVVVLQNDNIVHSIYTCDKKFRDPKGIGVGSTFGELKNKYREQLVYYYPYMERFVDVGNGFIYYFPPPPIPIIDDDETTMSIGFPFIPPRLAMGEGAGGES